MHHSPQTGGKEKWAAFLFVIFVCLVGQFMAGQFVAPEASVGNTDFKCIDLLPDQDT